MQINSYLFFQGNCEEAMNFYKEALGGTIVMMQRFGDAPGPHHESLKELVMHGVLDIEGSRLLFSDWGSERPFTPGNNVWVSLSFTSAEAIEKAFAGLTEGGEVRMPLQDMFWGARFGMCTDKFGMNWMCNWDKPRA